MAPLYLNRNSTGIFMRLVVRFKQDLTYAE